MTSQQISFSPLIIPSPNPYLQESLYNKVPVPHPQKSKRIPPPILLNKKNDKNIDETKFSFKHAIENFNLDKEEKQKDNSFNLSLSSATSETEDDVIELENVTQYRRMLKRFKSGTVKEQSFDSETILTTERFANDYSGLASKILVPLKKYSCVQPQVKNKLEEIQYNNNNKEQEQKLDYYQKRYPKMKRGYSILDILELTCGNINNESNK